MSDEDVSPLGDLVDDILETPKPKRRRKYKPKGMLLGERRDTGEVVDKVDTIKLMDSLWSEELGITWEEHMSDRLNNFLS